MFKSLNAGAIGVRGSVDELIGYAKRAGFQGVDVNIQEIASLVNAHGAAHVKALFADAGLRMGAWGLSIDWRGDEAEYKAGLAKLADFAAAGAAVGATRVCQWVPAASEDRKFGDNFRWHIERFKPKFWANMDAAWGWNLLGRGPCGLINLMGLFIRWVACSHLPMRLVRAMLDCFSIAGTGTRVWERYRI